jgi:drug/metabolite transporter (DMT)-like permease
LNWFIFSIHGRCLLIAAMTSSIPHSRSMYSRMAGLTLLAMLAFAGNSLLCRVALKNTGIDAASFTLLRIAAGAVVLWLITRLRGAVAGIGNWWSALALTVYAAAFSFAYIALPAATGALLLFGAVQITMIGRGLWLGERLRNRQTAGFVLAVGGLVGLLLPGLAAPPFAAAALMLIAGIAWGIYSLRGKGAGDATKVTAGNFLRAVPIAVLLSVLNVKSVMLDVAGIGFAIMSGVLTSGLGYAIWYSVLPELKATTAATVQLSVPVIAALGGYILLAEPLTLRSILASLAILGGIALVIVKNHR